MPPEQTSIQQSSPAFAPPDFFEQGVQILSTYPLVSFLLMATFGAVAAHLMETEKAPDVARDFKRFSTRLFVTTFTCSLLWFGWDYWKLPLAPGIIACGIVSIWPKQMLEYGLGALKRILDAMLNRATAPKDEAPKP